MVRTAEKRGFFYGWYIVAAGTAVLAIHGASFTYGLAPFFVPLVASLAVGRGLLSTVFSFARLETGLLGPIEGYLIDRFGPRKVMLVGTLIFGGGFLFLGRIDSLMQFFVALTLMALGGSMAGFLPVTTAVQNWFSHRRRSEHWWRGGSPGGASDYLFWLAQHGDASCPAHMGNNPPAELNNAASPPELWISSRR